MELITFYNLITSILEFKNILNIRFLYKFKLIFLFLECLTAKEFWKVQDITILTTPAVSLARNLLYLDKILSSLRGDEKLSTRKRLHISQKLKKFKKDFSLKTIHLQAASIFQTHETTIWCWTQLRIWTYSQMTTRSLTTTSCLILIRNYR